MVPSEAEQSSPSSSPAGPAGGNLPAPPSLRALVGFWLVWWLLCAGLWMVLDDTTVSPELIDGAVAATIGATGATMVYAQRLVLFAPRARWALRLWRPLTQFGSDLGVLSRVLARALRGGGREVGVIRALRFDLADDQAERGAQLVLAATAGSFAPNTIVLGIDEESGVMLIHQLVPTPGRRVEADPLELG